MFNLSKTERVSMGLRKMTADYISMSKDHVDYPDKTTKFKYNTSGWKTGGRERILAGIRNRLKSQKNLHSDVNEIYSKLLEKIEESGDDFSVDRNELNNLDKFAFQNLGWLLRTIFTEMKKNKKEDDYHERFVSESDRVNDESIKVTTEDEMYKSGLNQVEEKDLDFDELEARKLLVKTLDFLKACQDTLLKTDNNHINALKLLQAGQAHAEFVETQKYLERTYGENETDSQIIKADKKTDLIASLGFEYNANIKQVAKRRLSEDYISKDQRLLNGYRDLIKACEFLEIPIIELDSDTIMEDEYIRKLSVALNSKNTVCVSDYDFEEFEISTTMIDIKKKYIRSELLNQQVPSKRIPFYFNQSVMNDIYKLKASEFRKLDSIISDIKHSHNVYIENNKFANLKEGEKHVNELMKESDEYKRRVKYAKTTLLIGHGEFKDKRGYVEYKGVFSEESLKIIREETERYFSRLLLTDPARVTLMYNAVRQAIIGKSDRLIVADGNGFLKYEDNGHYYERVGTEFGERGPSTKKFVFNKWLVNEKGFIVSKFLDADPKVREELQVHRTPNKDSFKGLIIKAIDGAIIYNGADEE